MNEQEKKQLEKMIGFADRCWHDSADDQTTNTAVIAYASGLIALQLERIATALETRHDPSAIKQGFLDFFERQGKPKTTSENA